MKRWLKTLKPYLGAVIIVIALLVVEAICELTLPTYTSKIIDTGIQNSGVEHACPEKITEEDFSYAEIFMTDEEKEKWEGAYIENDGIYELKDLSEKELEQLDDDLSPALIMDYQFSSVDEETMNKMLDSINEESDSPVTVTAEMLGVTEYPADLRPILKQMEESNVMSSDDLVEMKNEMNKKITEAGGDVMQESMAIAYAKQADARAGINLDDKQQSYLWSKGGMMMIFAGIMVVTMILVSYCSARVGAAIGRDLRQQTYAKVMRFSNVEIEKFSTASLITRTTNDVQQIQLVTIMLLKFVLYAPILAIGGVIKVVQTGGGLWWTIALAVAVILGIIVLLISIAMPKFKIVQKLVDNVNRISREILTGIPVIRAFGREKEEEERFSDANKKLYKTQLFIGRVMSIMMPVLMFIMFGVTVLVMYVSAGQIDAGNMQVGELTAFLTYAMLILMSFLILTMLSIILPRSIVAANRIDEVLTTEPSIKNKDNAIELKEPNGVVEFKNVSFRYPEAEEDTLTDVSFKAEPGKTTAIIGSTGCGKTTLVQLIPRLYDVTSGEIELDGHNIKDVDIKALRGSIGYVPQQRMLFSGTIKSNIAYGNESATMEEIEEAAQIAQAQDFIHSKKDEFEFPIAQGGTNVSGGQNQRIQIARALAKHPKIMLFDDSFSALDMKTDKLLREALKEKVSDTTFIIVAQRVGTIMDAEQIIVLEDGKVVGKGTHKELLKNCEEYREIAESQLSKEELYGKEGEQNV